MAQRGRCPAGGRPSVSANKRLSVSRDWQLYRPVVKIHCVNEHQSESGQTTGHTSADIHPLSLQTQENVRDPMGRKPDKTKNQQGREHQSNLRPSW